MWFLKKEGTYSHLNMEAVADAYYKDAKRIYKYFGIKILG